VYPGSDDFTVKSVLAMVWVPLHGHVLVECEQRPSKIDGPLLVTTHIAHRPHQGDVFVGINDPNLLSSPPSPSSHHGKHKLSVQVSCLYIIAI
jgi:hypothetical protein